MADKLPTLAEIRARIAEIRGREQAATPGPWEPYKDYGPNFYAYLLGEHLRGVGDLNFGDGEEAEADRAFVTHAREDMHDLLAILDLYVGHEPTLAEEAAYVAAEEERTAADLERARQENARLRSEMAAVTEFRDHYSQSAAHLAAKRDLAEQVIGEWQHSALTSEQAVELIRKALAVGPVPTWMDLINTATPGTNAVAQQAGRRKAEGIA